MFPFFRAPSDKAQIDPGRSNVLGVLFMFFYYKYLVVYLFAFVRVFPLRIAYWAGVHTNPARALHCTAPPQAFFGFPCVAPFVNKALLLAPQKCSCFLAYRLFPAWAGVPKRVVRYRPI